MRRKTLLRKLTEMLILLTLFLTFPGVTKEAAGRGYTDSEAPPTYTELLKNYREIRRKYRTLEFFSLGIILLAAGSVTFYVIRTKSRMKKNLQDAAAFYVPLELLSREDCCRHLRELCDRGVPVTISTTDGKQYVTRITEVDPEDNSLTPEHITFSVSERDTLLVEYVYDEIPYAFSTRPLRIEPLSLEIPHFIKYTQRRSLLRTSPPPLEDASLILDTGERIRVHDISTGGISFLLERAHPLPLLFSAKIQLPGTKSWWVTLKKIYEFDIMKGGKTYLRLGCAFQDPPEGFKADLSAYLTGKKRS